LKKAASERVEIAPAKYEDTEEQILVKPAEKRIEVVPAEYGTGEERDQTASAPSAYQRAKGLPLDTGSYFNVATVRSLGANA